jgi:hypothetical protein
MKSGDPSLALRDTALQPPEMASGPSTGFRQLAVGAQQTYVSESSTVENKRYYMVYLVSRLADKDTNCGANCTRPRQVQLNTQTDKRGQRSTLCYDEAHFTGAARKESS